MSVLDHDVLESLERDLGDAELVREVLQLYLDQLLHRQRAVTDAVVAGDLARLHREAHTLGSASAVVGAAELRELCRRLESTELLAEPVAEDPLVRAWSASCAETETALTARLSGH